MKELDVLIIGAGAAGCFSAICASESFGDAKITILERNSKALAKVKVSGGGRCNVTNVISDPAELSKQYPRGGRFLKKAFYQFSSKDMKAWLEQRNISLKLYPDGCYFPLSNDSQTIIDCFLNEIRKNGIDLLLNQRVESVRRLDSGKFEVKTPEMTFLSRSVIVTTGGQPKISGFGLLKAFDLNIIPPVPSLFTFNMPNEPVKELMGIVQENAIVKIIGEKWSSGGPLLITHWGMSGPAVLKCSAFGARVLEEKEYRSKIAVNWTGEKNQEVVREMIRSFVQSNKLVANSSLYRIKTRLWNYLTEKAGIPAQFKCSELTVKHQNKLLEVLMNDLYSMEGKTTFKEEFVTAGGIDLNEIHMQTMESKKYPGLFFAGEVMDIDGVTGGFNFQAAWTTAAIAGKHVLLKTGEE
ncbi:NAD(P)/FAD-dependent oxidoreductase [Fluviicola sp.]|jgi:predicted Rossmann fold flavoprotein|uniref:NAD(P)/FAD-dependent oxidoreductase n=1 Tax=Fluviicola sp. TaxID=1917219 RepID=UPI002821BD4F|nr:NAD(P)/FAD-dependent oxidoreductase [Fluviicola sp.]MDR0802910.1 NAD(P)/FAD-dependent oxidoreductase [Fluviicola sp.]